jgi:uncharacterized protein with ParB-like and HNH nuclease domain
MSYKRYTIKQVIADIDQKKIYLPALQRKFVWGKHQIELLFDSLMRNYPFGTFLFWRLHRQKAESYVFYEFLTEYDQRNPYNRRKTGAFLHPEITGVLDGQQRLSSMYIGLMGIHTEKARYKRSSNPNAYEKMCLYLNLLSLPYTIDEEDKIATLEDHNFEFRFWTEEGAASSVTRRAVAEDGTALGDEAMFWMKVGQVLAWDEEPETDRLIGGFRDQCRTDEQKAAMSQQQRFIKRGLDTLHKRIQEDELINYFDVAKDDLEDILKIFVRVNSGGTILSKTDLLFSTIVATWDDGREQIEKLLKTVNEKGDGFNFGNEYLMRCCLVLSDGPVIYKVKSFKSENVQRIRDEWPEIAEAVSKTVDLLVEFGFSGSVLTSQNATIIIAYYLYKGGDQGKESKESIRKYLIHALLNGIYGSSQEQLITTLRNAFREEARTEAGEIAYRGRYSSFSFEEVLKIELPQKKSLAVTDADIERFLQSTKGPSSFFVLSLLYLHLRFSDVVFHQDHIHPASGFSEENFRAMRIPEERWQEWWDCRDCVPNLQLMNGRQNIRKNATPLKDWVGEMTDNEATTFASDNYFPQSVDLEFKDFMAFFLQRKEVLRKELEKVLALTSDKPFEVVSEWSDRDDELEAQESRIAAGATE